MAAACATQGQTFVQVWAQVPLWAQVVSCLVFSFLVVVVVQGIGQAVYEGVRDGTLPLRLKCRGQAIAGWFRRRWATRHRCTNCGNLRAMHGGRRGRLCPLPTWQRIRLHAAARQLGLLEGI